MLPPKKQTPGKESHLPGCPCGTSCPFYSISKLAPSERVSMLLSALRSLISSVPRRSKRQAKKGIPSNVESFNPPLPVYSWPKKLVDIEKKIVKKVKVWDAFEEVKVIQSIPRPPRKDFKAQNPGRSDDWLRAKYKEMWPTKDSLFVLRSEVVRGEREFEREVPVFQYPYTRARIHREWDEVRLASQIPLPADSARQILRNFSSAGQRRRRRLVKKIESRVRRALNPARDRKIRSEAPNPASRSKESKAPQPRSKKYEVYVPDYTGETLVECMMIQSAILSKYRLCEDASERGRMEVRLRALEEQMQRLYRQQEASRAEHEYEW